MQDTIITTEDLIDAIHLVRRKISVNFDGDLVAIAEDAARRQLLSGRPVWQTKKKKEGHETNTSAYSLPGQ